MAARRASDSGAARRMQDPSRDLRKQTRETCRHDALIAMKWVATEMPHSHRNVGKKRSPLLAYLSPTLVSEQTVRTSSN
jgi:hypothetical protein